MDGMLHCVWELTSTPKTRDKVGVSLTAGGICIDPRGILMTVTLGVKPDCETLNKSLITVTAKQSGEKPVRVATLVENMKYKSFGVCFFRLSKVSDNEVFQFYPILDIESTEVDKNDEIFAYTSIYKHPFKCLSGMICYSFRGRISVPESEMDEFVNESGLETRTISSYVDEYFFKDTIDYDLKKVVGEDAIDNSLSKLNKFLPLIQVEGLGSDTFDGQCGFPVFTKSGNRLVGLIAFGVDHFQLLIPTQILHEVYNRNSRILDQVFL